MGYGGGEDEADVACYCELIERGGEQDAVTRIVFVVIVVAVIVGLFVRCQLTLAIVCNERGEELRFGGAYYDCCWMSFSLDDV